MGNKYTVVGDFRQPHKDCLGETLSDLSYEDAVRIVREWRKEKKYKNVFYFMQDYIKQNVLHRDKSTNTEHLFSSNK